MVGQLVGGIPLGDMKGFVTSAIVSDVIEITVWSVRRSQSSVLYVNLPMIDNVFSVKTWTSSNSSITLLSYRNKQNWRCNSAQKKQEVMNVSWFFYLQYEPICTQISYIIQSQVLSNFTINFTPLFTTIFSAISQWISLQLYTHTVIYNPDVQFCSIHHTETMCWLSWAAVNMAAV